MWENLKRASKLMFRSKTFMVPAWEWAHRPLCRGASCKRGGGWVRGMPEPSCAPKAPATRSSAGAEDLPVPCGASGRSCELLGICCALCRPGAGALLAQLVQALQAVARPGLSLGRPRTHGSAAGSWKASLCQATISARNDIPRGGSVSARLPAGPPPSPPPPHHPFLLWPLHHPLVRPVRLVPFTLAPAGVQPAQQVAQAACPQRGGGD